MRKWLRARLGFANDLILVACFTSYKKWVKRGKCVQRYLQIVPCPYAALMLN